MIRRIPDIAALDAWWSRSRHVGRPVLVLALCLFVGGCIWAASRMGLSLRALDPRALVLLAVLAPVSLGYSALGLKLMARAGGTSIPFSMALGTSAMATIAELLPIPGGAIVRTGGLVKAGVGLGRGSALVLLAAVLWIAAGALGAGLAVVRLNAVAGWALLGLGAGGGILALAWLATLAGARFAATMLLYRVSGLALLALRLKLAFAVLGVVFALVETMPFVLATIAGSAAAIVPAGLGVSEALAALAASSLTLSGAAAFLAVGVDRIVQVLLSGLIALVWVVRDRRPLP
ncbi:hypothetical protein [Novosphingobium sp. BW1]|uniref:hypothetical protein n=1 Tax=Novosphingobium sp. BW1 TaxID=2592621 RepID=UPI0011DEE6F6|nr:hypothetical protein [Novosphingobium sp. BW1]TYC91675.1 hypothetical protein FMM79_04435 [Novosphingobium sp. BW1]